MGNRKFLILSIAVIVMMLAASCTSEPLSPKKVWDKTADVSWFDGTKTEFLIETEEQLAGLAKLVNDGNEFEGITIKLGNDMDLNNEE